MIIASQIDPTAKDSVLHFVPEQSQQLTVGMARIDEPPPYVLPKNVQPERRPVPPVPRTASNTSTPKSMPAIPSENRPVLPVARATSSTLTLRSKPEIPATNYIFVKTRQEPVTGVFHIDPELQTVALDKAGATAVDRRVYNCAHRQKHRHHSRKNFKKRTDLPDPNAIFETRQGALALDLHVVASPHCAVHARTLIQATTRQGPLDIRLHSIHPQRRLNMEVRTRHGDICILIPRSFSGYIQLYHRDGQLLFLPHLASAMTLVSRHEREAQVVVGDAVNHSPALGTEWVGDTMHIASRHGNIFVGYVGEDTKPPEAPGFWRKLTGLFQPSIDSTRNQQTTPLPI